jgi:hypothetical protein
MLDALWSRIRPQKDPYEEFYLNATPKDPRNRIDERIRGAPDGSVFAVKAETHTPEVMADHVRQLGKFFGVDAVHIVRTEGLGIESAASAGDRAAGEEKALPYAIFCLLRAEHDARDAPGIGGHAVALKAAFATFQIAAIIREFGFEAHRLVRDDRDAIAARAGIGTLDARGRLTTRRFGAKVHVADVILTDLPVAVD